ncbi:hypothetical protein EC968_009385 [Mortierella alpina]|nr:hypothetical protein EC968_009385 [Mortierella alpina]
MVSAFRAVVAIASCGLTIVSLITAIPVPHKVLLPRDEVLEVDWCNVKHCEASINPICVKRSDGALKTLLNPCQLNVVNCVPEGAMFEFLHKGTCD